jgi:tRNA-dihydrouridine synthase B
VDINFGCPVKKIVGSNAGAVLMKEEDLAVKIAASVVNAVKIPVTVKMRLGWDSENINCLSLAKKFEEVGVQMLTIHCRTRTQMYNVAANWSAIGNLWNVIKIPYICNGDIKSYDTAMTALSQSQAAGIMIGRAALGKPWLLRQIMDYLDGKPPTPSPSIEEQFNIVMQHFHSTLDFYGEIRGVRVFRKHFCWYSRCLSGSSNFREIINKSSDTAFIKECVRVFYEKHFLGKNKNT